jgi:predicted ATPase/DNA-binding SARP family transcriptional activator
MERAAVPIRSPESRLDIRLFGHADVTSGGASLKFSKRATTLAMLGYLVLKRGKAVSRDALAYVLFPESEETAALSELRRYLYLAAKVLPERTGEPWLIVDSETVRWNDAADAFVDVVSFEGLAASSETHAAAIDLYGGDLLEDVYDDWILAERERLRSRYLAILGESIERHRARREFAAAIAYAKRLLATDPWREDALRSLVAMRYESGDTAGALAEYEAFAKRLRDDLAIAPMPETVAVRQSILRSEAVPGSFGRPPEVDDATVEKKTAPTATILPFVGRQRELATLHAAWARAARGLATFVTIGGEAGVGKTRLTAEVARTVQAEGGRVFVGTTSSPESTPYQALVEAMRSALPLVLARPPAKAQRAALARLLPELRDPDAPSEIARDEPAERETARIFEAFAHVMRGLASPRPLLLVLEDLQWSGSVGIEALGAILRDATRAPLLIVATYRDEETPLGHPLRALQRTLQPTAHFEDISLERLDEGEVASLVARVEGLRDRGATIVRELYAQTEGNALFLSEAINVALEGDAESEGHAESSVARVVGARVARLGADARTVAEIASVAGTGASVALIREVSNLPVASVARGIDELLDRRLLREAGARTNYDYVFTHHLIADAIYGETEPSLRALRHARIARVLEAHLREKGGSSREIARHYERGDDIERAAQWYLTAARESAAVYAYADTVELVGRALALAPPSAERAALLDVRERAHGRQGDRAAQRADIDELERIAGDDKHATFDVLLRRTLLARALGESDDEGRTIAAMEHVARDLGDEERAQALLQSATHAGLRSRQTEGIVPAREALTIYERLGDARGQLECLILLVDFTTNVGDLDASRAYLEAMHARADSLADRAIEARALVVAATAALLRQEYRECIEMTERALPTQIETGDREAEAASRGRLAAAASFTGAFRTALDQYEKTLATFEAMGHKRGLGVTYTNRAMLLLRLGLFDDALDSIERSKEYFESARERRTIVANLVNASFVKLQLGDARAAKDLAQTALPIAKEIGFPAFEAGALANLGNAERALGEFDDAIGHMEAGIALRRPIQEPHDFVDDLSDLALAYVDAGRTSDALTTAAELERIGEESFDGSLWPQYPWWAISRAYAAAGKYAEAREAAARARAELERFARSIDDERARAAFLGVPVNRTIATS